MMMFATFRNFFVILKSGGIFMKSLLNKNPNVDRAIKQVKKEVRENPST
ncbi:hypothetical protein SAMN05660472_02129 [Natronincola ferrireducens]|uniref:Uncharacterized protein n=1 Tax=Natronincola ferrireducens TaxID=393762 RepID=A0A1G9FA49_9FIRM|nr:hypothetical protein SAMN05660472_02129 [Natronincola ferrireducens]